MKRLVIYFHYDPAGCIDTACRIAVQAVQKYGRVVFVTNGTLAPADRVWVRQSGAGRIERGKRRFRRRRIQGGSADSGPGEAGRV